MSADLPVLRFEVNDDFKFKEEIIRIGETLVWCEDYLAPILFNMNQSRQTFFGQDFGRNGDLSVVIPLQEKQDATYYAPFVLELRNIPFEQQKQILHYIIDRLPRFTHGALDARGNGQYLAEVTAQKYGQEKISEVMLSENWYRENMPRYKAAFEDATISLPKDADLIEDHRAFKMIRGVARLPEGKTQSTKGQRHGDSGIAGALAWYSTGQESEKPIEFQSTGVSRTDTGLSGFMGR
jgi:phage FluMu gp28-like protein